MNQKYIFGVLGCLWLLPLCIYFALQFVGGMSMPDGDVFLYHFLGQQWVSGGIPFIDYFFEYPPASVLVFVIPALITINQTAYVVLFQILSWVLMLGVCLLLLRLYRILRHSGVVGSNGISEVWFFVWCSVISWVIMILAINRFDTFAAFFSILGLVLFIEGIQRKLVSLRTIAIVVVLFAALIKLYPVFLLPFFGLYELKESNYKALINHIVWNCAALFPFAVWMWYGRRGLYYFLTYHSDRYLEIESLWAVGILWVNQLSMSVFGSVTSALESRIVYEYGSFGLRGELADALSGISLNLFVVLTLCLYAIFFIKLNKDNALPLLQHAFIFVTVGFATFNKVFSAQYVIWFLPFLFLYLGQNLQSMHKPWAVSAVISIFVALTTIVIFPLNWGQFIEGSFGLTTILLARNLLLLGITTYSFVKLLPTTSDAKNTGEWIKRSFADVSLMTQPKKSTKNQS